MRLEKTKTDERCQPQLLEAWRVSYLRTREYLFYLTGLSLGYIFAEHTGAQ